MDLFIRKNEAQFQEGLEILTQLGAEVRVQDESYTLDDFVDAIDANKLLGIDYNDLDGNLDLAKRVFDFVNSYGPEICANNFEQTLYGYLQSGETLQEFTDYKLRFAEIPKEGTVEEIFGSDETRYQLISRVSRLHVSSTDFRDVGIVDVTWKNGQVTQLQFKSDMLTQVAEDLAPSGFYEQQANEFYRTLASKVPYGDKEMRAHYEYLKNTQKFNLVSGVLYTAGATLFMATTLKASRTRNVYIMVLGTPLIVGASLTGLAYFKNDVAEFNSADEFISAMNSNEELKKAFQFARWEDLNFALNDVLR